MVLGSRTIMTIMEIIVPVGLRFAAVMLTEKIGISNSQVHELIL